MLGTKVVIDGEKCDGCGLCVKACHEGALELIDGKAVLVNPNMCDGLGDCLPACPQNAITFEKPDAGLNVIGMAPRASEYHWPIQIALSPIRSEFLKGTVVIGADCTAFASRDLHDKVIKGKPVLIGCPKLDPKENMAKINAIVAQNPIDKIVVIRMEVPCCRALSNLVKSAAGACGRDVAVEEVVVSRSGAVLPATQ